MIFSKENRVHISSMTKRIVEGFGKKSSMKEKSAQRMKKTTQISLLLIQDYQYWEPE